MLQQVAPEDNVPFITDVNKTQVENAIFSAMDFVKMRVRKRKAEEEGYKIAKEAAFSWKTATKFMKNGVFDNNDDLDEDTPWWEKPELSKEKKMEKMRAAERDVKFEIANKKKLVQQPFRNRYTESRFLEEPRNRVPRKIFIKSRKI